MDDTLETHYADILRSVPTGPVGHPDFVFTPSSIGAPPALLPTSNLVARVGVKVYSDSYRIDFIDMILGRTTSRSLGCLVLSIVLHGGTSTLRLERPESRVKKIVLECEHPSAIDPPVGLSLKPFAVRYFPAEEKRHPWDSLGVLDREFPSFVFTNEAGQCVNQEQLDQRDTVQVTGRASGLARFGELLLNAGRPDAEQNEFNLEVEAGVAFGSAELSLWLPGSLIWNDELSEN